MATKRFVPLPMPSAPPPPSSTRTGKARLLSGNGSNTVASRSGTRRAREDDTASFTATLADERTAPPAATAAPAAQPYPGWFKGVVIGGLVLAAGMPLSVLLSRSMLVQESMLEQSNSKAALVCTAGSAHAMDDSSLIGWLFGGSYFSCDAWETRDAQLQRERERDHANYLARQRAKQQGY